MHHKPLDTGPPPSLEWNCCSAQSRCTREPKRSLKVNTATPLAEIGRATAESAARAARISMDSAERAFAIQLEYARGALQQATINARAVAQVKDVQELFSLRSRIAENAIENMVGYS